MYGARVIAVGYVYAAAVNHVACVNLVFEEKCGDARFGVAVYHGPVYGGGSAVAGQQ